MRAGGSSAKGAQFERSVCVAFSLWISSGKREDLYWRTAMSGGRATLAIKGGKMNKSQLGDICAVDPEGALLIEHFVVECKSLKKLDLATGLVNKKGLLCGYWHDLCRRCRGQGERQPLMIAKENGTPPLLLTTRLGIDYLGFERKHRDFTMAACRTHHLATLRQWQHAPEIYLFDALKKSEPYL